MLDDADTALVMNWVIDNFSQGRVPPDFKPFTAAEIHHARAEPHLFDITEIRTQLLRKMVAMTIRSSWDATAQSSLNSRASQRIEELEVPPADGLECGQDRSMTSFASRADRQSPTMKKKDGWKEFQIRNVRSGGLISRLASSPDSVRRALIARID